jgi:hypothetical protein
MCYYLVQLCVTTLSVNQNPVYYPFGVKRFFPFQHQLFFMHTKQPVRVRGLTSLQLESVASLFSDQYKEMTK